jgi:RND family efflux transporter MFP subunit
MGQTTAQDKVPLADAGGDRPVLVRSVHFAPAEHPRLLVGTLRARIEADQGFRIAGKIIARNVQLGDRVKAGDVLAALDPADLSLQRESVEAERSAAASAERQAALELERVTALRQQGWSTEQVLERQKAALEEATGRRSRAERAVAMALNTQSYAQLRADADGIVIALDADVGQVIAAGQPIARIARHGDREALVAVPENELPAARHGKAEVTLWSDPDKRHPAKLREISPNADAATRTFQARYVVEGLPADAPLGMTIALTLTQADSKPVARLPLAALLNDGRGTEVFVVEKESGILRRRPVTVIAYGAADATISTGLAEGEDVVVLGVHKLREGLKVRVQRDPRIG